VTVLVTGAAGFAGSHLLDRLAAQPSLSVVGWQLPDQPPRAVHGSARWQSVELLDAGRVNREIEILRPDVIYHLAGIARVDTSFKSALPHLQTNVLGTHHLLQAVKRHAPRCRVLVVTSGLVYKPSADPVDERGELLPANPYALSKLAQDQLAIRAAEDEGLDVVVARPFNHVGPRQEAAFAVASFARQVALAEAGRTERVVRVGNLDAERDLTDVRDVVAAYELLAQRGGSGEVYNIASGRATRIGDVLEMLLAASTVKMSVDVEAGKLRARDTQVLVGNADRLRSKTGWMPTFPLSQTLGDTLDWWRAAVRDSTFA